MLTWLLEFYDCSDHGETIHIDIPVWFESGQWGICTLIMSKTKVPEQLPLFLMD